MKNLITVDCGSTGVVMFDGTKNTEMSPLAFLEWVKTVPAGTWLVGEYAHFGCPRRGRSKAQPFTAEQLKELYAVCEECGINLRLFPQQSTPRALNYALKRKTQMLKKGEADPDAEAIWLLLQDYPPLPAHCPRTSLMYPPKTFEVDPDREEAYKAKARCNQAMNEARAVEDGYYDADDKNFILIRDNIEEIIAALSPMSKSAFGLDESCRYKSNRNGNKVGKVNLKLIKMPQIYSVLVVLQQYDGTLNIREKTGQLPGWKFAKRYIFGMTPFHLKGGVVRSNMYWHGMRHWINTMAAKKLGISKADFKQLYRAGYYDEKNDSFVNKMDKKQEDCFLKYRRLYCKAIKELYTTLKTILERERASELGVRQVTASI